MTRTFTRLRLIFLTAFVVLTAAAWAYQFLYVGPQRRCEAAGNWWDAGSRQCGHVLYIPDVTHRPVLPGTAAQGGVPVGTTRSAPPGSGRGRPST